MAEYIIDTIRNFTNDYILKDSDAQTRLNSKADSAIVDSDIAELQALLDTVVNNVSTNTSTNSTQDTAIANLQQSLNTITGGLTPEQLANLAGIAARIQTLETNTGTNSEYNVSSKGSLNARITNTENQLQVVQNAVSSVQNSVQTSSSGTGVEITSTGTSPSKIELEDDVSIKINGTEQLNVNSNGVTTSTLTVTDTLNITPWAWIKQSNNNLTLKWIGTN